MTTINAAPTMERGQAKDAAFTYMRSIRNAKKRQYALFLLGHYLEGMERPERGTLSAMAAQAVDIEIRERLSHGYILA